MTELNQWELWAEETETPRERREAAKNRKLLEKQIERSQLEKLYRIATKERRKALLEGPMAKEYGELLELLERATLETFDELVAYARRATWLAGESEALSIINRGCVHLREAAGLKPFSDPLPWQPLSGFHLVRSIIEEEREI